ncbi:MAG: FtsX-like permease family protein [Actinomycetota bacterium]|nr:FtsX-like permease family protein [Actinomycetota bacterium]
MSNFSRKRRRDMRRQRWQFLAVGVTVVIGVTMYAATYDSYLNLTASYEQTYDRLAFADMTITGGNETLPDTIEAIPGVQAVTVRHTADIPITIGDDTLLGRMVGTPAAGQPDINKLDIQQGEYLSVDDDFEAVAEVHVARTFDLEAGDTFTVVVGPGRDFTVVGTAASAEYIWPAASTQDIFPDPQHFGVFFVDEDLVALLPPSVSVRETLVLYDDDAITEDVDAAVHDAATDAGATGILIQADHPSQSTLELDVEGFGEMAIAFPILFLTAAGMAVYVLLTRIVFTQRSIIGTLRASGMSARELRRHYLSYGLWVGTVGAVVGVLLGAVSGALMTRMYTGFLDIPDTVIVIRPSTIIVGLVFGVVIGTLSALVPARAAYKIEPAEAMRGAAPLMTGGRSLMEKAIPPLSRLSVRARMTLRGMGRSKRRSLATVLGVVLALVLILASGGMIDSIVNMVRKQFEVVYVQDASVIASEPVNAELFADIDATTGVTRTEPVAGFSASITADGETLATTLQGFEAGTQMHGWTNPSGDLPPSGMLAGAGIADKLGVSVGDRLVIDLPTHDVSIELEVVEFVEEPLGIPLYARYDVIAEALRESGVDDPESLMAASSVTTVMTLFDPAIDRTATIDRLEDVDGVLAVQDARSLYNTVQQFLGLAYAFTGIMLLFGAVMAFSLMFNTISVNIAERSTEFATLKASGMSDRTIGWMIVGENLFLTLLGIVPGVILGVWAAGLFMGLFSNDSFNMSLMMSPWTVVIAAASMIAVALLSLIPGVRSVKRLDIGAVVRERAV